MSLFKRQNKQPQPSRRRASQRDTSKPRLTDSQLFRRGRTMSGSGSEKLTSRGQGASSSSSRSVAHELANRRRHLLKMLAGVMLGLVFTGGMLWQLIASVSVYGGDSVAIDSDASYDTTVNEYLKQNPLERLRFAIDEESLTAFVVSSHPEVESVRLAQPDGLASSKFELTMRKPIAQWHVAGETQYVDDRGVAFIVNYYGAPDIKIVDNSGIDPQSGATVASGRFLGFIGNLVRLSKSLNYTPTGIEISSSSTRQIEVQYEEFDYPVKFTIDRPAGEQVEDMSRVVQYLRSTSTKPRYVDVRISGRTFYR